MHTKRRSTILPSVLCPLLRKVNCLPRVCGDCSHAALSSTLIHITYVSLYMPPPDPPPPPEQKTLRESKRK